MKEWISSAKTIVIPLLFGLLAAVSISGKTDLYDCLVKPPAALPSALFGAVWTLLYLLMGTALLFVRKSNNTITEKQSAEILFFVQLILNVCWPVLFFCAKQFLAAFFLWIILFVFVSFCTLRFYALSRLSGGLLMPYLLFLAYAGYLNFGVWYLNL